MLPPTASEMPLVICCRYFTMSPDEILALDEALSHLATEDLAKAELVKLRYFGPLLLEECAAILGISLATAKRRWAFARAWLYDAIQGRDGSTTPSPT